MGIHTARRRWIAATHRPTFHSCNKSNLKARWQSVTLILTGQPWMHVSSLSSFARHPERSPSSYNKHKEMQQLLHVQRGDHSTDALCRVHGRKSGCVSGWMHVLESTFFLSSFFFRTLIKMYTLLFHLCTVVLKAFCVYLIRGTAGALLFARMKICGGLQESWAGERAALSRTIQGFTAKWLNSWTGSMTWLR